ncbi:MAG: hypothetical protein HY865_09395 [Chloroflexi bacterium]|nr:hypothetical protein [Chloroflexota bacterium]
MDTLYFKSTGKYQQEITNETHHQSHLAHLASLYEDDWKAELLQEDHGGLDSNAVVVMLECEEAGELSRPDALRYREKLKALGYPAAIGMCRGKLTGGDQSSYGVLLDLDIENLEIDDIARSKT